MKHNRSQLVYIVSDLQIKRKMGLELELTALVLGS